MARAFKIGITTVVTLLFLLIAILITFVKVVDPTQFKKPIEQRLSLLLNREVTIEGKLDWDFVPWLSLTAQKIIIKNAPGFGGVPFAQVGEFVIELKLVPLLFGNFDVNKISMLQTVINLSKQKDGHNNWSGIFSSKQANDKKASDSKNFDFSIANFNFRGSKINYTSDNENFTLYRLSFGGDNVTFRHPFQLNYSSLIVIYSSNYYGDLKWHSTVTIDPDKHRLEFTPMVINLDLFEVKNRHLIASTQLNLNANFNTETNQFISNINGNIANLNFKSNLQGELAEKNRNLQGKITIGAFNLREFIKTFNLMSNLPAKSSTFTNAGLSTNLNFNNDQLVLDHTQITLDKSNLVGNLKYYLNPQNTSTFNFNLNTLDLTDYLSNGKASNANVTSSANLESNLNAQLRKLNLDGKLFINKFSYNKLAMNNLQIIAKAKNGMINVNPITANLYQGKYSASLNMNANANTPVINTKEALQNIQIQPLFNALVPNSHYQLTGVGNISANLTTQGLDMASFTKHLNGTAAFSVQNGALQGIDLGNQFNIISTAIMKKQLVMPNSKGQTPFSNLSGTLVFTNGIASNDDLSIVTPLLHVNGKGVANLITQTINYNLALQLASATINPPIYLLQQQIGGNFPLKVSGTFADIKIYPDMINITKGVAKSYVLQPTNQITGTLNKGVDKLLGGTVKNEQLKQQLQKGLNNLLQ